MSHQPRGRDACRRFRTPCQTPAAPARDLGPAPPRWIVGLAAVVLMATSLGSYFYHRWQLDTIAAGHLRLMVLGPSEWQAGAAAEFHISTTTVTGDPLPAQIALSLHTADGKRLVDHIDSTDATGRVQMVLPADIAVPARLPARVQLQVVATRGEKREEFRTFLTIAPLRYLTRLAVDRPQYLPGETVAYRWLSLSRLGLTIDRPLPIRFEILDAQRRVVPGSQHEGLSDHGAGQATFALPQALPDGCVHPRGPQSRPGLRRRVRADPGSTGRRVAFPKGPGVPARSLRGRRNGHGRFRPPAARQADRRRRAAGSRRHDQRPDVLPEDCQNRRRRPHADHLRPA